MFLNQLACLALRDKTFQLVEFSSRFFILHFIIIKKQLFSLIILIRFKSNLVNIQYSKNYQFDKMSDKASHSRQVSNPSNTQQSKKQYCLRFIQSLIQNPLYRPFLRLDDFLFGFLDFYYITKSTGPSLLGLREELINKKHFSFDWFVGQLNKVFVQISDYILLDDPLQSTCEQGLRQISKFARQFKTTFSQQKTKKQESFNKCEQIQKQDLIQQEKQQGFKKQKRKNRTPSFKSQLQMVYYLKNFQNDEQVMRKIGEVSQILSQNQQQYVFDLGKNSIWQDMIDKSNKD